MASLGTNGNAALATKSSISSSAAQADPMGKSEPVCIGDVIACFAEENHGYIFGYQSRFVSL